MLKVIGAGLPRTGTSSQFEALPKLLGGRCYHMHEVMHNPEHIGVWIDALDGRLPTWDTFLDGYTAAVDWPASVFWPELAQAYPDAVILLSTRADGATWYRSMADTVLAARARARDTDSFALPPRFTEMTDRLWERFVGVDSGVGYDDAEGAARTYERYVQHVRDTAPPDRLLEWNASEGWGPLCEVLDLPVPAEPFPKLNTTADFQRMLAEGGPNATTPTDTANSREAQTEI